MIQRSNILVTLILCTAFTLLNVVINNSAYAYSGKTTAERGSAGNQIYGKVIDTINVSGYTYAEVDDGKNKVWAAGPVTALKVGDMIAFSTAMPMKNYHSKSLERDFSIIYFTERFITDKEEPTATVPGHDAPHAYLKQKPKAKTVTGINKADGGNTIAEIYAQKKSLSGKTIRVRGQITKVTNNIMGKNWLHIRDSSTTDDLTVTTRNIAVIDDVVIIEGKLELDKDFSYGYVYPVIVEDATIVKE